MNDRSDIKAKETYVNYLTEHGYVDVQIVHSPVDIIAYKNGVKHFFEIKATKRKNAYFGAATFTEWECALKNKEFFKFVVVIVQDTVSDYGISRVYPQYSHNINILSDKLSVYLLNK